eukprot:scaffold42_cov173-Ochromonas_danica.AAC.3
MDKLIFAFHWRVDIKQLLHLRLCFCQPLLGTAVLSRVCQGAQRSFPCPGEYDIPVLCDDWMWK